MRDFAVTSGLPPGAFVSASSGTSALIGAILGTAGAVTTERPVAIMPALTFVATAVAAERCGYRVHFKDVDANDWTLQTIGENGPPGLQKRKVQRSAAT